MTAGKGFETRNTLQEINLPTLNSKIPVSKYIPENVPFSRVRLEARNRTKFVFVALNLYQGHRVGHCNTVTLPCHWSFFKIILKIAFVFTLKQVIKLERFSLWCTCNDLSQC